MTGVVTHSGRCCQDGWWVGQKSWYVIGVVWACPLRRNVSTYHDTRVDGRTVTDSKTSGRVMGWETAAERKGKASCDCAPGLIWAMIVRARERGRETPMVVCCEGGMYSTATETREGSPSWSARRTTGVP